MEVEHCQLTCQIITGFNLQAFVKSLHRQPLKMQRKGDTQINIFYRSKMRKGLTFDIIFKCFMFLKVFISQKHGRMS